MTKIDEINAVITSALTIRELEDTPHNRITMLTELGEKLLEERGLSIEKRLYVVMIGHEIVRLRDEIANS